MVQQGCSSHQQQSRARRGSWEYSVRGDETSEVLGCHFTAILCCIEHAFVPDCIVSCIITLYFARLLGQHHRFRSSSEANIQSKNTSEKKFNSYSIQH